MYRQRNSLLFAAMTAAAVIPAVAQTPSTVGSGGSEHSAAWIPDFSRVWTHPAFPWFEPPASGPGPITNLSRWAGQGLRGSLALPAGKAGISNYDQLTSSSRKTIATISSRLICPPSFSTRTSSAMRPSPPFSRAASSCLSR